MLLNLNDPETIVKWWAVWPERHGTFLEHALKSTPQFAPGIREAQRRIAASPELSEMLAKSAREQRDRMEAIKLEATELSAYVLRMAEFA